jgi:hypothetical protein
MNSTQRKLIFVVSVILAGIILLFGFVKRLLGGEEDIGAMLSLGLPVLLIGIGLFVYLGRQNSP